MDMGRTFVLVIDDEKQVRELVEMILADAGFSVTAANDGEAALGIFETHAVDLAVVDIRLPGGLDGPETIRRARAKHPGLKVIFTSGAEPPPGRCDPDRDDFVTKPFRERELLGCVFELLLRNNHDREQILSKRGAKAAVAAG
jgi:DNA-binding response OmpR family regulator